ncbi:MAG: 1-deoxy-D-xylulose-5-phosphate synthase, partial [Clostridia bacterium]|nr:1-deoxy-D-xylulose-5-phosphate synthase [Clostridia bacterium]
EAPTAFHGIGAFQVTTGKGNGSGESYSSVFGKKLVNLAERDATVCAITAAMPDGTGLKEFSKRFSNRFFDVGIAEQHAVTFAAGLAKSGLKPVFPVYSSFLQRAYDQLLHDVCLQNLHFVVCVDRAGLVGEDGETHQGLYDIAYLTQMPHMSVLAPANFVELSEMLEFAVSAHNGPIAIRYPRGGLQASYSNESSFVFGKADWVNQGERVCLIAVGHMLKTALFVCDKLKDKGINASVLNLRTVKPLDSETILKAAESHELLVTLEDGIRCGGVGEQIAVLACRKNPRILIKAHKNGIVPHGSCDVLYTFCGLDADTITQEVLQELSGEAL